MLAPVVIRSSQWRLQPWKNGRGMTREVLRLPDLDDYEIRFSVAEVTESGPFSTFPGYGRWTVLIEGGPISLERGKERIELAPGRVVALDGEDAIEAHVEGKAYLLNVIAKQPTTVGVGDSPSDVDFTFDLKSWDLRVERAPARGHVVWVSR